jgi:dolichyl-diphosphooligosaccharide---protein glycosyltransferase subunit DAD1/OST2
LTSQSEFRNEHSKKMAPKRHAVSNTGGGAAAAAAASSASQSSSKVTQRSTNSSSGLASNSSPQAIIKHVWQRYLAQTPQRTLLLDAFMAFLVLVGGIQFVYCVLAGNYVRIMASCLLSPLCCGSAFVGFSAADY